MSGPIIPKPDRPWVSKEERDAWIAENDRAYRMEQDRLWGHVTDAQSNVVYLTNWRPRDVSVDPKVFKTTNVQSWLRVSKER